MADQKKKRSRKRKRSGSIKQEIQEKAGPPVLLTRTTELGSKKVSYKGVDYNGMRLHVGTHVSVKMTSGDGVGEILRIFEDSSGTAKLLVRWYWTPSEIREVCPNSSAIHSMDDYREIVWSNNTEIVNVTSVWRMCTVLARETYENVFMKLSKDTRMREKFIFFCFRKFDFEKRELTKLSSLLLPGDPVPQRLLHQTNQAWRGQDCSVNVISDSGLGFASTNITPLEDDFHQRPKLKNYHDEVGIHII